MATPGWIGVDLDGTLARMDGWNEGRPGAPIKPMVKFVKQLLDDGQTVKIFTARASMTGPELEKQIKNIQAWCKDNLGQVLPITNAKDFQMIRLYDDRARQVEYNTGKIIGDDKGS